MTDLHQLTPGMINTLIRALKEAIPVPSLPEPDLMRYIRFHEKNPQNLASVFVEKKELKEQLTTPFTYSLKSGQEIVGNALIWACHQRNVPLIKTLLGLGADPNTEAKAGEWINPDFNAYFAIARCGSKSVALMKVLLDNGPLMTRVSFNVKKTGSNHPNTLLHHVISMSSKHKDPEAMIELLLTHNNSRLANLASIDTRSAIQRGKTALFISIHAKFHASARILLKYGANPNILDKQKWTPLHMALQRCHLDAVTMLVEAGAMTEFIGPDAGLVYPLENLGIKKFASQHLEYVINRTGAINKPPLVLCAVTKNPSKKAPTGST